MILADSGAVGNRWDTGRTEAFSDGVLALAITLLVLDIGYPHQPRPRVSTSWRMDADPPQPRTAAVENGRAGVGPEARAAATVEAFERLEADS